MPIVYYEIVICPLLIYTCQSVNVKKEKLKVENQGLPLLWNLWFVLGVSGEQPLRLTHRELAADSGWDNEFFVQILRTRCSRPGPFSFHKGRKVMPRIQFTETKRTGIISLRLRAGELKIIREAARDAGESTSEFLRRVAICAAKNRKDSV